MTTLLAATCNPDHWGCGRGWGPGPWIGLFWLALFGTLLALWLTRWRHRPAIREGEHVLAERYARGEIDEGEYRSRRDVLRNR
jgi:putative membrane protein